MAPRQTRPELAPLARPKRETPTQLAPLAAPERQTEAVPESDARDQRPTPSRPHAAPTQPAREFEVGGDGDRRAPAAPFDPSNPFFMSASSGSPAGTTAAGLCNAILLGFAGYGFQRTRGHSLQYIALESSGFTSPRQRPG